MDSLSVLKRRARESAEAFEEAKARIIGGLKPSDALVDCEYCDKVFVVHDDGRKGWACTCSPRVFQSARRA